MKWVTIAAIMLILILLVVLLQFPACEEYLYGHIRIPAAGLKADVYYTYHGYDCGCCGALWNGGQMIVKADVSAVNIDDVADLTSLSGERMVLECVEIVDCLSVGELLLTYNGRVKVNGDVLMCVETGWGPIKRVYRWIVL